MKPHIRWMIKRDMAEVLEIEALSFRQRWTEKDFLTCLRQRNCIGIVAEVDERVVGFMIYELHKEKFQLINCAVHPEDRRIGVGTAMVEKIHSKLSSRHRTKIDLISREGNLPAHLFFKANGFEATKVIRSYYADTGEDGYAMELRLDLKSVRTAPGEAS